MARASARAKNFASGRRKVCPRTHPHDERAVAEQRRRRRREHALDARAHVPRAHGRVGQPAADGGELFEEVVVAVGADAEREHARLERRRQRRCPSHIRAPPGDRASGRACCGSSGRGAAGVGGGARVGVGARCGRVGRRRRQGGAGGCGGRRRRRRRHRRRRRRRARGGGPGARTRPARRRRRRRGHRRGGGQRRRRGRPAAERRRRLRVAAPARARAIAAARRRRRRRRAKPAAARRRAARARRRAATPTTKAAAAAHRRREQGRPHIGSRGGSTSAAAAGRLDHRHDLAFVLDAAVGDEKYERQAARTGLVRRALRGSSARVMRWEGERWPRRERVRRRGSATQETIRFACTPARAAAHATHNASTP